MEEHKVFLVDKVGTQLKRAIGRQLLVQCRKTILHNDNHRREKLAVLRYYKTFASAASQGAII